MKKKTYKKKIILRGIQFTIFDDDKRNLLLLCADLMKDEVKQIRQDWRNNTLD